MRLWLADRIRGPHAEAIADCGIRLVAVEDDRRCGDDWVSYQYFFTRDER